MKIGRLLAGIALPVLVAGVAATPAHAARTADVKLTYAPPEIADDDSGVTWNWTIANDGDSPAEEVVVSHRITPDQKILKVSDSCKVKDVMIVCAYGTIKAGDKREGSVRTSEPTKVGSIRINGKVTWREADMQPGNATSTGR